MLSSYPNLYHSIIPNNSQQKIPQRPSGPQKTIQISKPIFLSNRLQYILKNSYIQLKKRESLPNNRKQPKNKLMTPFPNNPKIKQFFRSNRNFKIKLMKNSPLHYIALHSLTNSNKIILKNQYREIKLSIRPIMTAKEETNKQIKEMKEFNSVTTVRKFTQEAMAPVIRSLEVQISAMIDQQKQLNKRVNKADDVCKSQTLLQQKIQDINKVMMDFKTEQADRKRQDDRKFLRLESANQKLFLQLHSLKSSLQSQNQKLKQMSTKNNKMLQTYNSLTLSNDKSIKQMQYRYNEFTKDILDMTKAVRQEYQKNSNQIQVARETFRNQRNAIQEKTKNLELFMEERKIVQEKFQDLYGKIINSVTKEDFQGYRKSQKIYVGDIFTEIKNEIHQILPPSLREQLPKIQKKLKQIDHIKTLQKSCNNLQIQLSLTSQKLSQFSTTLQQKLSYLDSESKQRTLNLSNNLMWKLEKIEQKQSLFQQKFQQKLQEMKLQIQEEVSSIVERETSELQKTIEAEVRSNKGTGGGGVEYDFVGREQLFWKEIQEAKMVKQKIIARYDKIQEIGRTIDKKIQNYSSSITRIKSDYQLFAQNMRKQVSGVIKFRDTFLDRLQDVGKILSSYTEALLILSSIFIQKSEEQSKDGKESVVYITDNDGIIFEFKPQIEKGWIQYRKQKMEIKQFLRSYMYSLTSFTDDQFTALSFLNWKDQKPSAFFKERVFTNYCISSKRISDHAQKQKNRRSSCFSSSQNQTFYEYMDPTASTKQFSRTIQSKLKFDKVLEQAGLINQNQQNKKGYSIKRSKPASGRPNQKQKSGVQQSRYDQMFLSSRSACRSRISQAV